MSRSASGWIAWSAVATIAHDGSDRHAGVPVTTEVKASTATGRWVSAITRARSTGTSAQNASWNDECSMSNSVPDLPSPVGYGERALRRRKWDVGVARVDVCELFVSIGGEGGDEHESDDVARVSARLRDQRSGIGVSDEDRRAAELVDEAGEVGGVRGDPA